MDAGELVPDDVIIGMVRATLEAAPAAALPARRLPAHPAQAAALDALLAEHGARITAAVALEVDDESWCSGCCGAPSSRAAPTTTRTPSATAWRSTAARPQPLLDYYAGHGALRASTGSAASSEVTGAHPRGAAVILKRPPSSRPWPPPPHQPRGARRGRGRHRRRRHDRRVERRGRGCYPRARRQAGLQGLSRLPRHALHVRQRGGGPRHPVGPPARGRRHRVDRHRYLVRRLRRRHGAHLRHRPGLRRGAAADRRHGALAPGGDRRHAPRQPPGRRQRRHPAGRRGRPASGWCASSSGTASAARSTSSRTCRTSVVRAPAPSYAPASSSPSNRWSPLNRTAVEVLEDGWTAPTADGCLAAHVEHTVAVTDDGPWVLTAPESDAHGGVRVLTTARAAGGRTGREVRHGA
jgi:hypothetical protein